MPAFPYQPPVVRYAHTAMPSAIERLKNLTGIDLTIRQAVADEEALTSEEPNLLETGTDLLVTEADIHFLREKSPVKKESERDALAFLYSQTERQGDETLFATLADPRESGFLLPNTRSVVIEASQLHRASENEITDWRTYSTLRAMRAGYSPELFELKLTEAIGREIDGRLVFDRAGLMALAKDPQAFSNGFSAEALDLDEPLIEKAAELLQETQEHFFSEGFNLPLKEPLSRLSLSLLEAFGIEASKTDSGSQLGCNRLQRARLARLLLTVSVDADNRDRFLSLSHQLVDFASEIETKRFFETLTAANALVLSPISAGALLEWMFALVGKPLVRDAVSSPLRKLGLYARYSVELPGGTVRLHLVETLKHLKDIIQITPGDRGTLIIQCGEE